MTRTWLFAAACLTATLASPATFAQTRSWASVATGLWNAPARWSPADVPNTPAESATFDLFGSYAVTIDGSSGPVAINHLNIVRGDVTLRPNGVTDATITASGNVSLNGKVTLAEIVGTHLQLQAQGALTLGSGTQVFVDRGTLTASSTTIAGGTATDATLVQLLDGATGNFGALSIAPTGSVTSRSGVDLYDGAAATVLGMSISTAMGSGLGEVNVTASTLTQPASRTATIGAVSNPAGGLGLLTISDSGTAQLGSVVVNATGGLYNNSGMLRVTGPSFTVRGGKYQEKGTATRDFAAATNLLVEAGGEVSLVGAPLTIASGQTLTVFDGTLKSTGGVVLNGGALSLGGGASVIGDVSWGSGSRLVVNYDAAPTISPLHVDGVASLAGTLDFQSVGQSLGAAVLDLTVGSTLPLLTAGSIVGEFDAVMGPALASGLSWSFEQTPTSLVAKVVGESLAGDFNGDGLVNAADYTVWRDSVTAGNPVGAYATWAAHYGATLATGPSVAVPEPGVLWLLAPLAGALSCRRRGQ